MRIRVTQVEHVCSFVENGSEKVAMARARITTPVASLRADGSLRWGLSHIFCPNCGEKLPTEAPELLRDEFPV